MAPPRPVYAAVISVATMRQQMARAMVLLCDSVISSPNKKLKSFYLAYNGKTIQLLNQTC